VLQEGEIRPVGSARALRVNVRVISATNRDLDRDMREGRFREDLYYRLAAVTAHVPPLRDRPMDVPLIARDVLERAMAALGKPVEGFAEDALAAFCAYRWPGNVRELQNEVQRMLALAAGPRLGAGLLSARVRAALPHAAAARANGSRGTLRSRMEALEVQLLQDTLARHHGNKSRAASELGLSRVGLRAKLVRYGLERKLDS
jgi:two-component system response regulator HupR/HoxA